MSFQPVIPLSGLAGWGFLKSTQVRQSAAFEASPILTQETDYFKDAIGDISTAEELVSDRRLLKVALGAFGLSDDIDNRYFIQKVLEDGTLSDDALANKLTDTRYRELSSAFGFGDYDTPRTKISDFGNTIVKAYQTQSFEIAVGEQDESYRLAMYTERELSKIADKDLSDDGKWYLVMGSEPMRTVFEKALSLPDAFGQLDIDQQLKVFRSKSESFFGSGEISHFGTEDNVKTLVDRYLVVSQISDFSVSSSAQIALSLLQS